MNTFVALHKGGGYSSELEDEEELRQRELQQQKEAKLNEPKFKKPVGVPSKSTLRDLVANEQAIHVSQRGALLGLNAYDRHKKFINDFVLHYGLQKQYTQPLKQPKTDLDVLREEYRLIRSAEDTDETVWEQRLAKKYYDKLFKEYALADMSRYKEGKVGLRWRTQEEVFRGKGQFICGNKACSKTDHLKSYEVNFAYVEAGERKNALVKLRVCPECADMLNYKTLKKQQKMQKKLEKHEKKRRKLDGATTEKSTDKQEEISNNLQQEPTSEQAAVSKDDNEEPAQTKDVDKRELESHAWAQKKPEVEKTKEEEYEEYFEGLFL